MEQNSTTYIIINFFKDYINFGSGQMVGIVILLCLSFSLFLLLLKYTFKLSFAITTTISILFAYLLISLELLDNGVLNVLYILNIISLIYLFINS